MQVKVFRRQPLDYNLSFFNSLLRACDGALIFPDLYRSLCAVYRLLLCATPITLVRLMTFRIFGLQKQGRGHAT